MSIYSLSTKGPTMGLLNNTQWGNSSISMGTTNAVSLTDLFDKLESVEKSISHLSKVIADIEKIKANPGLASIYTGEDLLASISGVEIQSEFTVACELLKDVPIQQ